MRSEVWIAKALPALILVSLWLDGRFYPLLLLPLLYVFFVEKKGPGWLGFRRAGLSHSASLGAAIALGLSLVYVPVFLHYLPLLRRQSLDAYTVFSDVLWYPLYEEIAYRSFALAHFAESTAPVLSRRNLLANLSQSLLFLSIHRHHLASGMPLVLAVVFALGLFNGFLFLRTRNIYGCLLSHSALNSVALMLREMLA